LLQHSGELSSFVLYDGFMDKDDMALWRINQTYLSIGRRRSKKKKKYASLIDPIKSSLTETAYHNADQLIDGFLG